MAQTLDGNSIPNLLINGGFEEETPDGLDPVCWTVRDARATSSIVLGAEDSCPNNISAISSGDSQGNFWTRVTQPQRYPGLRTFMRLAVNNTSTPVEMFYDLFLTRLASTIARDTPPLPENYDYTTAATTANFNQYRGLPGRTGNINNAGPDLLGKKVTIALSYFVEEGSGQIELAHEFADESLGNIEEFGPDPTDPTSGKVLVSNAIESNSWKRVGKVFQIPSARAVHMFPSGPSVAQEDTLRGLIIRLTRTSESDAFIVYVTAVAMVHGEYGTPDGVPYNGDLSYILDPRNIVRPSFGETPPPGFRPFTDVVGSDVLVRFPSGITTDPTPLQLDGSETHIHELSGRGGVSSKKRAGGSGDAGARTREHVDEHEVSEALNAPTSRSAYLTIKL